MSTIKRSKTDAFSVKESVNIVKLAEAAFEQISLDQLTDVVVETPTDGDILVYSSDLMAWENVPQAGLNYDLEDLANITITSVSDGQVLTWDSSTSKWVNETPTTGATTLDGLTDVNTLGVAGGMVLMYNSDTSEWNAESLDYPNSLDDLTDVTITTPSNGQVLKYNGSAWVNGTDSGATPGGSDTYVQYNDGGVLGGESTFTYNKTNNELTVSKVKTNNISGIVATDQMIIVTGENSTTAGIGLSPSALAPTFFTETSVYDIYHEGNTKTVNGQSIAGSGDITVSGGASTAAELSYDNSTSGLASTDVQGAIDELNTVAGALANIRGTAWRSFDWASSTFYTRTAFGSGFSTLDVNRRYASIECHMSASNSGGYISGNASTPPANIAVLGPWANNWTGIVVFTPYNGANDVSTTAGLQDSSSGTATASLFGVEYSLANGWEIVFRYASADLKTRVPFTMTSDNMILEVYYESDAAQTVVELIRVTVREYPSGDVIATDTWTGSTAFNSLYWKLKSYKVGSSALREYLYNVLYMGDGFNPPAGLSFD